MLFGLPDLSVTPEYVHDGVRAKEVKRAVN